MLRLLTVAGLGVFLLAGCGQSDNESITSVGSDTGAVLTKEGPTPVDESFLDELREGTFTVCKVAEGSTMMFTFNTTALGPGVNSAPVYEPEVMLGDMQCADVYTAPTDEGIGPDTVTISEMVPEGWQVDRIAIWSREEQSDGSFLNTFHEAPEGATSVEGSIDAGKIGCVVIFYNSEIKKCEGRIGDRVWNDVGGIKGIQDLDEPGIKGVRVVLEDDQGMFLAEDYTDDQGYYLFEELCAGDYRVCVDETTVPEGWMQTPTEVGDDRCIDNNVNCSMVTLTFDDSEDLCVDFGYMAPPEGPGTGTPGYWHKPENWPVESIEIGGTTYTKYEATDYINMPVRGDKTMNMFAQLVSAKLNVYIGNDDSCIADTIADADAWMADHPVGSGVQANSEAWDVGGPLHTMLDQYNNGLLCAPHRD
jgi:hypothetical protein